MPKQIAIIAGDIHYNLKNLEIADQATRMAISKANELGVPFIANGDTHDQKAQLRAECVNRMIDTFKLAKVKPIVNIGNHCKINEKSIEHALNFLEPYAELIATPKFIKRINAYVIPYHSDAQELRKYLKIIKTVNTCNLLIMHQGLSTALPGEYTHDKSALSTKDLVFFRTILSHYHTRQDIKCGKNMASYIGSPYTQSFAEANDPEKGYQILYSDGSLEFVPTNLRKHALIELEGSNLDLIQGTPIDLVNPEDIVKVRIIGSKEQLVKWTKDAVSKETGLKSFSLELLPTKSELKVPKKTRTKPEILDSMIDDLTDVTDDRKNTLKDLWKSL